MYEVIVNGQDEGDFEQAARDVDVSLEDERWWQDIKRLRQPNSLSAEATKLEQKYFLRLCEDCFVFSEATTFLAISTD